MERAWPERERKIMGMKISTSLCYIATGCLPISVTGWAMSRDKRSNVMNEKLPSVWTRCFKEATRVLPDNCVSTNVLHKDIRATYKSVSSSQPPTLRPTYLISRLPLVPTDQTGYLSHTSKALQGFRANDVLNHVPGLVAKKHTHVTSLLAKTCIKEA